jgi:hypothetical protein
MHSVTNLATAVRLDLIHLEQEARMFSRRVDLSPDKQRELHRIEDRISELREQLGMIIGG